MSENVTFYSCEQYNDFREKLLERCDGYYTRLWHGFLNYYSSKTDERLGYEVAQVGYYLINGD